MGTTPERIVLRRWEDDRELLVRPLGDAPLRRYGMPYFNVYRPDLIEVLARSVDGVARRFGTSVLDARTSDECAVVDLDTGEQLEADVVIGADGINSVVRGALFGDHPTRFTGWVAYRALIPREEVAHLRIEVGNRLGPNAHLVSYFVGANQRYLNLVCVVHEPDWSVESWTEPGDVATLRSYFSGWSPQLQSILDLVEAPIFKWALHDRTPLDRWTNGRIALLGDACHPMVPFMAQGACQALEDAAVLARCLDLPEGSDVASALATYEATRRPRASAMQARSFDNATVYHHPDGDEQEQRDRFFAGLAEQGEGGGLGAMDSVYGHDPFATDLVTP